MAGKALSLPTNAEPVTSDYKKLPAMQSFNFERTDHCGGSHAATFANKVGTLMYSPLASKSL